MNLTDDFTGIRIKTDKYTEKISSVPMQRYLHKEGWLDTAVDGELIFSHRNTYYTKSTFTEKFHMHSYTEIIFYIKGDIEYINENRVITPSPYTVIWFNPGEIHTARLLKPCRYERYVLYLSTDFFELNGKKTPIIDFISRKNGTHMLPDREKTTDILNILKKCENIIESEKPYAELVAKSLLIELFYMLNSHKANILEGEMLNDTMGQIKRHIDRNYATIKSINDVADEFFYSREHLSRKFMSAFNISPANYLSKRRIIESLALLENHSVADAAYAVGFHSQSAFINAFKKYMDCLPSEYKAKSKQP